MQANWLPRNQTDAGKRATGRVIEAVPHAGKRAVGGEQHRFDYWNTHMDKGNAMT